MPQRILFETRNHDQMGESIRGVYGAGVRLGQTGSGIAFRQSVIRDEHFSYGRMEIGASLVGSNEGFDEFIAARLRAGGYGYRSHSNRDVTLARGAAFVIPPAWSVRADLDSADLDLVQLDRHSVELSIPVFFPYARSLSMQAVKPLSEPAARAWWMAAGQHAHVLQSQELYENDMLRRTSWNHLLSVAVLLFGLVQQGAEATATAGTVQRAQRFMDENLDSPLTIAQVAAGVGCSIRSLQHAFQQHRGISPMAYLRMARLHAAREDLVRADHGTVTVDRIARRWGFTNTGRFASYYRNSFGHLPRDDLAR